MEKLAIEIVKVNDKGGITLPRSFREKFGLTQGLHICFEEDEKGDIKIRKIDSDLLKNGTANYQPPESGGERTIQGGNENEQMDTTERPDTRIDSVRLSVDQGKQESTDESRVEDPTKKVESRDGEDDPTS